MTVTLLIGIANHVKSDTCNHANKVVSFECYRWYHLSAMIMKITRFNIQDMYRVIESDYVPIFNHFKEYLNHLSKPVPSTGDQAENPSVEDRDYIHELAQTVRVKGGEQHMPTIMSTASI